MGLRTLLARAAATRPHVLIVAVPGYERVRIAAEAALAAAGGVPASSPADADVLLVAGDPGPQLRQAVDVTWAQLPGPRARVRAAGPGEVADALAVAIELLADDAAQRRDARSRRDTWNPPAGPGDVQPTGVSTWTEPLPAQQPGAGHRDHGTHMHGTDEHGTPDTDDTDPHDHGTPDAGMSGHDMQDHDMQDHSMQDHSMHGMGMELPGGLSMAERAEDRDGLKLDELHVPLGPILPGWPAGLVVHTRLQGDLVTAARAELLDDADHDVIPESPERALVPPAALALDALARFLLVADWPDAAFEAAGLRDDLLAGVPPGDLTRRVVRLRARVLRSGLLRARGAGVGVVDPDAGPRFAELAGDVSARWRSWLEIVDAAVRGACHQPGEPVPAGERAELAAELMVGLDLAAARLVVASLDIRPGEEPVLAGSVRAGL